MAWSIESTSRSVVSLFQRNNIYLWIEAPDEAWRGKKRDWTELR